MNRKPRITLVGPWPPTAGGTTTFMLNVVNSHLAEQYEFLAYTTSRPVKRKAANSYGYSAMLSGGVPRLLAAALVTAWHVLKFPFALATAKPDIVQVQASDYQAFWEAVIYVNVCRRMGWPVIMRLGGAFDRFYSSSGGFAKAMIRMALQWPDILIVQSAYWQKYVADIGRRGRVVVLPNSVPDPLVALREEPANSTPICLFSAGTEADRKGIADVIAAMRMLKERGIKVHFRLLAMLPHSQEQIRNAGLGGMAEIEGFVGHGHMLAAMRESDIFLLPSRGEGFPNALLEAMACGLASIVTPVGAIPEIVGADGAITIPARDAASLADAIGRLVLDPVERLKFGARAREIVRSRYTASQVLSLLDNAWRTLLARPDRLIGDHCLSDND